MNRLFVFFFVLLIVNGCNSPTGKKEANSKTEQTEEGFYGAKITATNPITGDELLNLLNEKDSVWVCMKSKIVATCQSSGCWMNMDLGNDKEIRVTFKDYDFVIPLDSEGKTATIEGFAKKEFIPVDLLKHYAEDDGASQEEIDAIIEPELSYTFEAAGVIIED